MSERIQRRRTRQEAAESDAETRTASRPQASDYDAILAEIDEVLESDAEEYVRSFVQKGGQ